MRRARPLDKHAPDQARRGGDPRASKQRQVRRENADSAVPALGCAPPRRGGHHPLVPNRLLGAERECPLRTTTTCNDRGKLPRRFAYMASTHRWMGFGFNYMYMSKGAPARSRGTTASTRLSAGACTRRSTTTDGWPEAPKRSLPLGARDMTSPPSRRQRPNSRARSPLSLARPSAAGREQKGRPLAQFTVPGARPTCPAPPSSSLTRPRCTRRSPRAGSDTGCDPSSPWPRAAATRASL